MFLRGSVGLDAADGLAGDAADGALFSVGGDHGEGGVAGVDGDHCAGVDAADADGLAGDGDDAGGGDAALDGDRLGAGSWWWSGWSDALDSVGLFPGQGVGAGPQQFPVLGVEDQ